MEQPDFLHQRLGALRATGQFRELPGDLDGVDFWSNDYLGFSRLLGAESTTIAIAPGSRLISGNHSSITDLEAEIAAFHGFPAALLFGSGYTANLGLLSCVARRTDTVVYDELIHASLRDGIRLSGAAGRRCRHNHTGEADRLLSQSRSDGQTFFVTESRFSMDGDTAPLRELAELCHSHGAHLIVDEAHATGLEGTYGAGMVAELGLQDQVFAAVATYGKAPGYHGAAILGGTALRDYLINFSRPFIYSTGPRPMQISGIRRIYALLRERQPNAFANLQNVIATYQKRVATYLPAHLPIASGPIQLVPVPGNDRVMALEERLRAEGLLVKGIRSPSVPAGTERLRVCLHAFNTPAEVTSLVRLLGETTNPIP
ncbi:8-amino-7-oxononanoate synthase [Neolewinella xylanilytica]|uniref:8-amino-7-oxononanoate synthase n=1 Tax=Neolewinella xylanilytica TaxID=1514080 RepID=A0A2S6I644_9BACT|nr:aminotransferase class I/II-fold pyridoxal phosphate-dependent enzyme [Neolewinella xylanilytica]PPK86620.1 8-amino-7-oxononanoate synthase [Neolewinella xylanilytica]